MTMTTPTITTSTSITVTITAHGHNYKATMGDDGGIDIACDGVIVGSGFWRHGRIDDCDAVLVSGDYEASEEVFEALDAALSTAYAAADWR